MGYSKTKAENRARKVEENSVRAQNDHMRLQMAQMAIQAIMQMQTEVVEYRKSVDTLIVQSLVNENQEGAEKLQAVLTHQADTMHEMWSELIQMGGKLIMNAQNQAHERHMAQLGFESNGSQTEESEHPFMAAASK